MPTKHEPSSWADEEVRTCERRIGATVATGLERWRRLRSHRRQGAESEKSNSFGMSPVDHSGVLSRWGLVSVHRHGSALMMQRLPLNPQGAPCLGQGELQVRADSPTLLVLTLGSRINPYDTLTRNAHIGHRTSLGVI